MTTPDQDPASNSANSTQAPVRHRRYRKLVRPEIQLRMVGHFLLVAGIALTLQLLLFSRTLISICADLPHDGGFVLETTRPAVMQALVISVAVILPLAVCVGILSTFRIAGPVDRFKQFLLQVQRGERPADCRLRKGDHLMDICALLNDVTRPLRSEEDAADREEPTEPKHAAA